MGCTFGVFDVRCDDDGEEFDPLRMLVHVWDEDSGDYLGDVEDLEAFKFNLRDAVDHHIIENMAIADRTFDDDAVRELIELRDALVSLAAEIDTALAGTNDRIKDLAATEWEEIQARRAEREGQAPLSD